MRHNQWSWLTPSTINWWKNKSGNIPNSKGGSFSPGLRRPPEPTTEPPRNLHQESQNWNLRNPHRNPQRNPQRNLRNDHTRTSGTTRNQPGTRSGSYTEPLSGLRPQSQRCWGKITKNNASPKTKGKDWESGPKSSDARFYTFEGSLVELTVVISFISFSFELTSHSLWLEDIENNCNPATLARSATSFWINAMCVCICVSVCVCARRAEKMEKHTSHAQLKLQ